ncbi:MAG: methionine--tRNA ligase [Oligoflexales bacterium]
MGVHRSEGFKKMEQSTFKKRKMLMTSALPYANGEIHIGHMVEHCITDFWVRYQKLRGHECLAICADDSHGTPIMVEARRQGKTPEEQIEAVKVRHQEDLSGFQIHYDHYSTTHSSKNREICHEIYSKVSQAGHLEEKTITQAYCEHDGMFLPDRFVKGSCPKCKASEQYGDHCESCNAIYQPMSLISPQCTLCGNAPVEKDSTHVFFKLADFKPFLESWLEGRVQESVRKKLNEWLDGDLQNWCISRDEPYFGFEIPGKPGKYFYVWFDAPIGYISTTAQWCESEGKNLADFWKNDNCEIYHNIGKDIIYFHALFWPCMLKASGYQTPHQICVHGMLTVDGEKLSKSRGTFINAKTWLKHLGPDYLRYYFACKLNDSIADMDLNLDDFVSRVNSDLVGKIVNVASRAAQMLEKKLGGELCELDDEGRALVQRAQEVCKDIAEDYENRQFSRAMIKIRQIADSANRYFDEYQPWILIKEDPEKTRRILSAVLNSFRLMTIYLKPVLPEYAQKVEKLFGEESWQWDSCENIRESGCLKPFEHLLKRVERKAVDKMLAESKEEQVQRSKLSTEVKNQGSAPNAEVEDLAAEISVDDFFKVDLRVAKILEADYVEGAKKLLRFQLDLGSLGQRQIFSGIRSAYDPKDLVGRHLVVVANLKARKMKFGVSEGMAIAAGPGGKDVWLVSPDQGAQPGMRIG